MNKYELIDKVVAEIAKDKGISEGEVGTYDTLMRVAEIAVKNCSILAVSQQRELLKGYEEWLENVDLNTNRITKLSLIDRYLKTLL